MTPMNKQFYIVEDDESVRRSIVILLATHGYSAQAFGSGEDFLRTVSNDAAGCLILDIHLPGINGWETHRRVVAAGSKRPVIIISADEGGGLMKRAYQTGATGYLQKPFKDQELIDLIHLLG